jgi:LPXTG-motif cell wall-anchored protein
MKTLESKSNRLKYVNFAAIGTAAVLASTGANATIISVTGLNQDVANGESLNDIGGMTGVYIDRTDNMKTKLNSSYGLTTNQLSAGTLIGPASTLNSDGILISAENLSKATGLYGVSFDAGSGAQYGWLDIQSTENSPFAVVTLNGWGYETDVGVSIKAGETSVNAPAGLALLAIGGIGLVASRRRKVNPVLSV